MPFQGPAVYCVHAVAEVCGVQAVAWHARAVREDAGSYGGSVFVCGAGRALAVAALGREGAVGAGHARVREFAGRVRGPAVRPLPGGQRQWSSSAEPGRASSPGGQGEGSTAPAGQ